MFTGIIEEVGLIHDFVVASEGAQVTVQCPGLAKGIKIGDSVAVNGVCLTAAAMGPDRFSCDISAETLRRSTLHMARPGMRVNLERALEAGGRLGGHFVQGHVDSIGRMTAKTSSGSGFEMAFDYPKELERYLVYKGSIAVNGISLTISSLQKERFAVSVIPHTLSETTLHQLSIGESVNLEVDILGKFFERYFQLGLIQDKESESKLTLDYLKMQGF